MNITQLVTHLKDGISDETFIVNGKLIAERELASRLNTSRANLRLALKQLELESIIWKKQGSGTFIGQPKDNTLDAIIRVGDNTNALEILEVRKELEPILAKYAALRVTPNQLVQIEDALERTQQAKNAKDYEQWDRLFHRKIAEAANNHLFLALYDSIQNIRKHPSWANLRESMHNQERQVHFVDQHQIIFKALKEHKAEEARQAMSAHIDYVSRQFKL